MKLYKLLRQRYFANALALIVLTFSCSQYDTPELEIQKFDYSSFNEFKSQEALFDFNEVINSEMTDLEQRKAVLNHVNTVMNTDIYFSAEFYELYKYDANGIFEMSKNSGWLSHEDIDLTNEFINNVEDKGLEIAIQRYENAVLELSLGDDEFSKRNMFLNMIKGLDYSMPNFFNSNFNTSLQKEPWYKCAAAIVALTAATASLGTCVTVVSCGAALVLVYAASNSVAAMCGDD